MALARIMCAALLLLALAIPAWASEEEAEDGARHDVVVLGGGIAGLAASAMLGTTDHLVLAEPGDAARDGWLPGAMLPVRGRAARLIAHLGLNPRARTPAAMDTSGAPAPEAMAPVHAMAGVYGPVYRHPPGMEIDEDLGRLDWMSADAWLDELGAAPAARRHSERLARAYLGAGLHRVSALALIPVLLAERGGGVWNPAGAPDLVARLAAMAGPRLRVVAGLESAERTADGITVSWHTAEGASRSVTARRLVVALGPKRSLAVAGALLAPSVSEVVSSMAGMEGLAGRLGVAPPTAGPTARLDEDGTIVLMRPAKSEGSEGEDTAILVMPLHAKPPLGDAAAAALRNAAAAQDGAGVADMVALDGVRTIPAPGSYQARQRLLERNRGDVVLAGGHTVYPTAAGAIASAALALERLTRLPGPAPGAPGTAAAEPQEGKAGSVLPAPGALDAGGD